MSNNTTQDCSGNYNFFHYFNKLLGSPGHLAPNGYMQKVVYYYYWGNKIISA